MRGLRLALIFSSLAASAMARAEEPTAKCSLRIIMAQHDAPFVDPQITKLRPYLEREPFDDWKHFKLVNAKEMSLQPKGSDSEKLPNGRTATITYVEHVMTAQGKHRVKLRLEIDHGAKKELNTQLVLDEGGVFLQAAQKKQTKETEMLILGISCEIPH
ncbi:MAG TPA: hypothetical protein VFF06_19520 [Polyangia bacterium]|nr:hypothetical protein [Polyangia bacterium]